MAIEFIPNGNGYFSVPNLIDDQGRLVQLPANRRWRSGTFYDSVIIPAGAAIANLPQSQLQCFNNDSSNGSRLMTNRSGNESIPKDSMLIADSFFVAIDSNFGNQRASGDDIAALLSAMHVLVTLGSNNDVLVDELAVLLGAGGIGLSGTDFSGAGAAALTNGSPNPAARRVFDVPILLSGAEDTLKGLVSFPTPTAGTRYAPPVIVNGGSTFTIGTYTSPTMSVAMRVLLGFRGAISP